MGMTLEESVDGLEPIESNGIKAYIENDLYELISQRGNIYVDVMFDQYGGRGFHISVKQTADEKSDCC
jgi:hypothetical protein